MFCIFGDNSFSNVKVVCCLGGAAICYAKEPLDSVSGIVLYMFYNFKLHLFFCLVFVYA